MNNGYDREFGTCPVCSYPRYLNKKQYKFDRKCDCCNNKHHVEIVKYCDDCEPLPPTRIRVIHDNVCPVPPTFIDNIIDWFRRRYNSGICFIYR